MLFASAQRELTPPPAWWPDSNEANASVVAVPVTDTCKEVAAGVVRRTVPRDTLVDVRGPWVFERQALITALDQLLDASADNPLDLCRAAGLPVRVHLRT